ncbi:MAG: hypothetical protein PHT02_00860 [Tissierellia bacterium]|nr:hypothetical protein [Tissierellia bacterium]
MNNKIFCIINMVRNILKEKYSDFPMSCCHEASIIFKNVLDEFKIKSEIYEGCFEHCEHYWNKINDKIVDLTIDQFGDYEYGFVNQSYYNKYKGHIYDMSWFYNEEEIEDEEDGYIEDINKTIKNCIRKIA